MISFLRLLKEILLETGLGLPPLPRVKTPVALVTNAPLCQFLWLALYITGS